MTRTIQRLAAAAAGLVLLAGCGGSGKDPGGSTTSAATAAGRISLTISDPGSETVEAHHRGARLVGQAVVIGRAPPRRTSGCGQDACLTRATVDDEGYWEARLRVTAATRRPYARVTAQLADESAISLVHLRGPVVRRPKTEPKAQRRPAGASASSAAGTRESEPDTLPAATGSTPTVNLDGSSKGNVLVIGDSLEVLTSPYLQRYLPSAHLTINAKGGFSSLQLFRLFQESYDPSQSVIVFDAGTNDNPNYPQILAGRLAAVAAEVGDRCMVVPTIHGLSVDGVNSAGKNRTVRAFVASRPGTQSPDWASAVAEHPELMQSDDLHPIPQGADYRAQLIAQGVRACFQVNEISQ